MPSQPTSYANPLSTFQNGGYYATVGRNSNYSTYGQQMKNTPMPFSYTNGGTVKNNTSIYSSHNDTTRPIYSTSHLNGQLNDMSLQSSIPPEQVGFLLYFLLCFFLFLI
ncbi:unnamed protein product [Nippostrongylus brasiliensis]|uniref:Uncharacterized protein n=1 Tax=Nippostrongylus brasiliensis TaxID=27835 RepID=A0A0N4XRJ2_NIPBR|nr:unnamed protein product [Nippostrongylus brasiliensis]